MHRIKQVTDLYGILDKSVPNLWRRDISTLDLPDFDNAQNS